MDRSLRPTCFVCLEVPLTVTFTVTNEADGMLWTSSYSESEHFEEDKSSSASLLEEHSLEHTVHESVLVSDGEDTDQAVETAIHFHPFEINDCKLAAKGEKKYESVDNTQIQNCAFNNETIDFTETPSINGLNHQCDIDGHILVTDEHPMGAILVNGLLCNRQELSIGNLNLLSDSVGFPTSSRSVPKLGQSISQGKVTRHSREKFGEVDTVSTNLFTFPRGIPVIVENSTMQKELGISKTELGFFSRGTAEFSLDGVSHIANEEISELTGNDLTADVASDKFKQKEERSHLDPGYFTEEGNEGSKDDLHANGCVVPDDSISKTDCDETASFDNGFHDESRETAARIDGVRSKIGILKHSKTSASLDLHKEHLPVSEHWADCYRALSNTMPSKTVAFCEQQLPKQKWDFTADTSEAMDRLRAITSHLCLPVILGNQSDGLKEHHSHQKASQLWRFKHIGADKDAPLADDPQQNLTLTFQDMNEFITGIEQELFQIKKSDEMIASQLLALYTEIRQYKYTCNCQLYREMMETAIDNEDKKDELSHHHVDTIPERLCATLKQWGLTRINLQRRRFSIF